jgi:hypothetical protein
MFESSDVMVSAQVTNEAIFLQRLSGLFLNIIVEKHSHHAAISVYTLVQAAGDDSGRKCPSPQTEAG